MAVTVVCPSCKSRLTAPPELLGRKVKCPDCGLVLVVPAVAYPAAPPAPPPRPAPRPAPRAAPRPAPLPDDDYDRPPPRRKSGGGLLMVGCLLGVLVLGVAAAAGWYIIVREFRDTARATDLASDGTKAPVPAGWELFSPPGGGFRVYMPDIPEESTIPGTTTELRNLGGDARMYTWTDKGDKNAIFIAYIRFPESQTKSKRDSIVDGMIDSFKGGSGGRELSRRTVRMAGRDATEIVIETPTDKRGNRAQIVCRMLVTPTTAYLLVIGAENGRPKSSDERGFFDSFELTGSVSTPPPVKK